MIKVEKMGKKFGLEIEEGEDKILFIFNQLNYFARNKIATLTTSYRNGKLVQDIGLVCFYNVKFGLKDVNGLVDDNGQPYQLEFEDDQKQALTDNCVDEIMGSEISSQLILAASNIGSKVPAVVLDPVTSEPVKGIKVVEQKNLKGYLEKK